jgi:hypothetical protein
MSYFILPALSSCVQRHKRPAVRQRTATGFFGAFFARLLGPPNGPDDPLDAYQSRLGAMHHTLLMRPDKYGLLRRTRSPSLYHIYETVSTQMPEKFAGAIEEFIPISVVKHLLAPFVIFGALGITTNGPV